MALNTATNLAIEKPFEFLPESLNNNTYLATTESDTLYFVYFSISQGYLNFTIYNKAGNSIDASALRLNNSTSKTDVTAALKYVLKINESINLQSQPVASGEEELYEYLFNASLVAEG